MIILNYAAVSHFCVLGCIMVKQISQLLVFIDIFCLPFLEKNIASITRISTNLYLSFIIRRERIEIKKESFPIRKALFKLFEISKLLIQSSCNVNSTSYCTTYHRVVTDTQEAHHFYVSRN